MKTYTVNIIDHQFGHRMQSVCESFHEVDHLVKSFGDNPDIEIEIIEVEVKNDA